jgi:hypothetical protein
MVLWLVLCAQTCHVGPSLYYGFIASGTGPNIQVTIYGFSQ